MVFQQSHELCLLISQIYQFFTFFIDIIYKGTHPFQHFLSKQLIAPHELNQLKIV